jgi:hypothetical protein
MHSDAQDPARLAVLEQLQRSALETYGEERCATATVQVALGLAANAMWRVMAEPLEPLGPDPLPTHC